MSRADLNRPLIIRERPRQEQTSKSDQSSGQHGTSVNQPTVPNQRKQDAGQEGGRGQGGSQHQESGSSKESAQSLRQGGATAVVRAVGRLTTAQAGAAMAGAGRDNVLLNVGVNGKHTYAPGSLIPRKYLERYYKLNLGKNLRVAHWMDEDETEGGSEGQQRPAITTEEYEQIVREMTLARLNRPMNRDLLASGGYDDV